MRTIDMRGCMSFFGYITGFLGFSKLAEKSRKKAAEWGFLLSTLFIVPLFFLHDASELVKIGMQLLWGACVSRAAVLANGGWKKKSPD
ncbi:hypothetical protein [Pantoea agglomerans]|uniref:hypothetical protein n=2 Tax=Enterobacter agglomerans TaxID=549 RepID=UPI0035279724